MTSLDRNQNEAYYLRLHMLVMEAQKVLRSKFDSIIKPADLTNTLKRVDGTLKKLKKTGIISKEQYGLLNSNPKSEDFDTTLLICLLQNICNLNSNDKVWAEKDNAKIKGNTDQENIQRIRNLRNKMQHKNVASLEQPEFESSWNILEKAMVCLGTSCGMHDVQDTINTIKTKTLEIVTPEMKSLRENTMVFLKEYQDDKQYYVKTKFYHQADKMLKDKNLTVLTGNHGEGKTTMAAYLALERSKPENCLKLAHASDWRKVDWSLKLFNTVIIDDIFGAGALNNTYVAEWKVYLPEIERAAKARRLNVIITSRYYIKEEALDELNNTSIFKDQEGNDQEGNIVHLASDDLTHNEKKDILVLRAKRNATEDLLRQNAVDIDECVMKSKGTINLDIDKTENFVFGFPQCANLFVQNDKMIKLGARFFQNPEAHFKAYIEQFYNARDDDSFHKFIALVIVWAEQTGRIKADDVLNHKKTSEHIRYVADTFGIDVNRKFMENIRSSLMSHQKDYLMYLDHTGEYKFNHNVVGDMVGVVLGEPRHKLVETIELCPRDFLMDRICLDDKRNKQFRVVVGKDNYHHLCRKVAKMVLRKDCNSIAPSSNSVLEPLSRQNPIYKIELLNDLDFGILQHPMFLNMHFVKVFMKIIKDDGLEEDIFRKPVMKITDIPEYTLNENISVLANALTENNLIQKDHTDILRACFALNEIYFFVNKLVFI